MDLPDEENVKVSGGQIETLILGVGQAEAHGEDRQRQGQQPAQDEQDGPYGETGGRETAI